MFLVLKQHIPGSFWFHQIFRNSVLSRRQDLGTWQDSQDSLYRQEINEDRSGPLGTVYIEDPVGSEGDRSQLYKAAGYGLTMQTTALSQWKEDQDMTLRLRTGHSEGALCLIRYKMVIASKGGNILGSVYSLYRAVGFRVTTPGGEWTLHTCQSHNSWLAENSNINCCIISTWVTFSSFSMQYVLVVVNKYIMRVSKDLLYWLLCKQKRDSCWWKTTLICN